ncbi:MAG TPA: hypothetical protein PLU37_05200 [Chitinophagaceae bacterium]|nr:hypothetical protein [Chitinophagaceae bacterium]HPG10905.1 hypothetical protein [Chitinophagaceae bacterium]
MQKVITTFLLCFILASSFGQTQKKISTYLLTQFNATMSDVTKGNNPWGVGLGLQTFLNNKTKFKPTIELTGDIYLEDDKVLRTDSTGTPLNDLGGMVNLFIGSSFNPTKNIYLSVVVGPSFISGQTLFGIKPSLGFYFTKSQRLTGKISYINVFNRGNIIKKDFTSLSLAVGLKLF